MSQIWEVPVGRSSDGEFRVVQRNDGLGEQQPTNVVVFQLPKHSQIASSNGGFDSCSLVSGDCSCNGGLHASKVKQFLEYVERFSELLNNICPAAWQKLYSKVLIPTDGATSVKFKLFDNVGSFEKGDDVSRVAAFAFGMAAGTPLGQKVKPPEVLPTPPASWSSPQLQTQQTASASSSIAPKPLPVIPTPLPTGSQNVINQSLPIVRRRIGKVRNSVKKTKPLMPPPCPPMDRKRVPRRKAKEATIIANRLLLESLEDVTSIDGEMHSEWQPSSGGEEEDLGRNANYKRLRLPMPYSRARKRVPPPSQKRRRRH